MGARSSRLWVALALAGASFLSTAGAADVGKAFKDGWNCAKSHGAGAGVLAKDLYFKGEQVAALSATAGKCLAASGADQQGFALVMAALTTIKIVAPESVPTGQCKPAVRNAVSRPFGAGISVMLPSGSVKTQLKELLESDAAGSLLWDKFTALPPPVSTYASHVDCACEFIDGGLSLADLSAVSSVVSDVSATCADFLDSAGLGFINDLGGAAIATGGKVESALGNAWEDFKNEPEPAPDPVVYHGYWGLYVPNIAANLVESPGSTPDTVNWGQAIGGWVTLGPSCYQTSCLRDIPLHVKECVHYYRTHRFSDEHADRKCGEYRDRASGEAVQLAKQWRAMVDVRGEVEARLKTAVESSWVWRLPFDGTDFVMATYSDHANNWTTTDALAKVFPMVAGSHSPGGQNQEEWQYSSSGTYQAAREILPNVGFDPVLAAELAVAAAAVGFEREVQARWDAQSATVRDHYMGEWFPTPPGASKHGCPNEPLLTKACVAQLVETFDKVCLPAVRAAHVNAPNPLSLGVRMKAAEENCRSWIAPQVAKAAAMGNYDLGPMNAQLCGALPDRSEEKLRCQRRVSDAWLECSIDAIKANQGVAQVDACLEKAREGIAVRNFGSKPVPRQPATGPVDAPKPGSVPMQVPTPARAAPTGRPQAPRTSAPVSEAPPVKLPPSSSTPPVRAPARQVARAPTVPQAPTKLPPVVPPTSSGRPPAPPKVDSNGRPACPAGQVPQTRRDGVVECVTRAG